MKLITEPGALVGAVRLAARALADRSAYPILGGLKIDADGDGSVQVSAFDYDTSARARVPAEVGEPGTVLVPGRLLAEICARLPAQPASLATDGPALVLACGTTRYRLATLPLDQYPTLPGMPGAAGQADAAEFAAVVRQVAVAASRDDTLPLLSAVQVTFTTDALTLVATDRYRATFGRLPWQPSCGQLPPPVLVPAPALTETARAATEGPVSVHVLTAEDGAPAVAGFACSDEIITTRLTAGDYPDMASKIPPAFAATALVDTAGMAEAVRRLAVVAARETPVHLAFTPGQVELTADADDQAHGSDTVACDLDGDPVTVAFSPARLLDAVTATGSGRTRIALTTASKPALITPADGDDADGTGAGYRHLLMPIRAAG